MASNNMYEQYAHHVSLEDYLAKRGQAVSDKENVALTQICLVILQHMTGEDTVVTGYSDDSDIVFAPSMLDTFVPMLLQNPAAARLIAVEWKEAEIFPNGHPAGFWHTLKDVKLAYTWKRRAAAEEVPEVLRTLSAQLGLPKWRRVYLDAQRKTVRTEQEFPGWLVALVVRMIKA